jgi:hypothetical protein
VIIIPLVSGSSPKTAFVDSEYSPARRLTPITTTLFDAAIEQKIGRLVNRIFCVDNSCSFVWCGEDWYLSKVCVVVLLRLVHPQVWFIFLPSAASRDTLQARVLFKIFKTAKAPPSSLPPLKYRPHHKARSTIDTSSTSKKSAPVQSASGLSDKA